MTTTQTATTTFTDIRPQWKAKAKARTISKADMITLCAYRAARRQEGSAGAAQRLKKTFAPITNPIKRANGAEPWGALRYMDRMIDQCSLMSWLTPDERTEISAIAKAAIRELK
jgi:hypothetical protein